MATISNTFTGNGSKVTYDFTFQYLNTTDIKIKLTTAAGVDADITAFTTPTATQVTFTALGGSATDWQETTGAPKNNVTVKVYRKTGSDDLSSTFYPGAAIRSTDLNNNFTQNLYVTQEADADVATSNTTANTAKTTADAAVVTANAATVTANAATTTANTANTTAASAVTTANTASTNASNAVTTANSASTAATSATTTANAATTAANTATTTANAATTTANGAVTTANTASTNATAAVSTANTASTNATAAVSTANTASTNASAAVTTANTASTNASNAVTTANAAAADVAAAVLYTSVANKAALEALTPSEDGYYEVKDSSSLANATWGTPTYTLSGIPGTYPSSALDGITTRLSFTLSSKTFAYVSYTVNDADNRYLAPGDLLDEDNMATNSATKVASQQSIKAYSDLKAPLASPTFTGTVAIPNIANLETAVAANTAKVTNVATNLSVTANGTSLTVASSDGTDATIPAVTTSAWGAMTDEDKTKLDGIATSATANVGDAVLANDQNWTGAQRGAVTALTDGATIAVDFNSSNNYSVTLAGNRTLGQPSNQVVGQSGSIFVTQDGTGSRTLAYHADYKWVGGTAPTLTTTAAAVDRIDYVVAAANKVHAVASLDVK